jgi:hypothetical protein
MAQTAAAQASLDRCTPTRPQPRDATPGQTDSARPPIAHSARSGRKRADRRTHPEPGRQVPPGAWRPAVSAAMDASGTFHSEADDGGHRA